MSTIIKDGGGTGKTVSVTTNNRLMTSGVSLTLTELTTESGDTYNIRSSITGLTSTNESALFYLENNESTDLLIQNIIVSIKDYVGTDGQPILKVYRNPKAGTLISNAVASQEINRNYGSNKTLKATMFEGVEGDTLSGEDNLLEIILPATNALTVVTFNILVVLTKGASIGMSWVPPSGMTTTDINIAVNATLNGTQL